MINFSKNTNNSCYHLVNFKRNNICCCEWKFNLNKFWFNKDENWDWTYYNICNGKAMEIMNFFDKPFVLFPIMVVHCNRDCKELLQSIIKWNGDNNKCNNNKPLKFLGLSLSCINLAAKRVNNFVWISTTFHFWWNVLKNAPFICQWL